jgi:hypothetical protein
MAIIGTHGLVLVSQAERIARVAFIRLAGPFAPVPGAYSRWGWCAYPRRGRHDSTAHFAARSGCK